MTVIKGDLPFFLSLLRFTAAELMESWLLSVGLCLFLIQLWPLGVSLIKSGDWSGFHPMELAASCESEPFIFSGAGEVARKCCRDWKGFLHFGKVAKTDLVTLSTGGKEERSHPSSSKASLTLSRSTKFL